MSCRSCGKQIEAGSAFCRYCGARQEVAGAGQPPATSSVSVVDPGQANAPGSTLERRLRHLFPRHHGQDEFMHLATIVAFVIAVVGFIFGFLAYALPVGGLATTWLLFAIALLLFLMVRESTLSHVRSRSSGQAVSTRYQAPRSPAAAARSRTAEGATAESSPPAPEPAGDSIEP
jgi:hypothetical protein